MDDTPDQAPVFTVGHSNLSLDRFVALLAEHGIGTLVDVRSVPFSRFGPQFNRAELDHALPRVGIR